MHDGVIDYLILNGRNRSWRATRPAIYFICAKTCLLRYRDCTLKMYLPHINLFLLLEAGLCPFHKVSHFGMPKMAKTRCSPF